MARNEEKAQSMLNRWIAYKSQKNSGTKYIESLGEQRIRDMNDEINNLLREKANWERKIIELGGPNYRKYERIADEEFLGNIEPSPETQDHRGHTYKYFGAAKNLPGVKELFNKKTSNKRRNIYDYSNKNIDAEYYGFKEEEDSVLEQIESDAEKQGIAEAVKNWEKEQTEKAKAEGVDPKEFLHPSKYPKLYHDKVPTREEMESVIVNKKKDEIMKKYASDQLIKELEQDKKQVEVVLGKK